MAHNPDFTDEQVIGILRHEIRSQMHQQAKLETALKNLLADYCEDMPYAFRASVGNARVLLEGKIPEPLVGPASQPSLKEAKARLYDILTSDIYTDAPEYADRVTEIYNLLPIVFGPRR